MADRNKGGGNGGDKDVDALLADLDAEMARDYPGLVPANPKTHKKVAKPGKVFTLGTTPDNKPFVLPEELITQHMHFLGAPGSGKTNALELFVQQAIANGRGLMLIDPHGNHPDSLYRRVLAWLVQRGHADRRTVHIIDPNVRDYTVGFNPLRLPDPDTDISVIADATLEAIERVWGEDMHDKPLIQTILTATFTALAELGLTLAEAKHLFDVQDQLGFRANVISRLKTPYAIDVLEDLHAQAAHPQ